MSAYVIRRILLMIPKIFGIMLVLFVIVQFAPGGPGEPVIIKLFGNGAGATNVFMVEPYLVVDAHIWSGHDEAGNIRTA
jgi:ABC-type microcin C transport system permease subunit YejB